jgi:hypothetical protein
MLKYVYIYIYRSVSISKSKKRSVNHEENGEKEGRYAHDK